MPADNRRNRTLFRRFGLVEQLQVVASTAVIVAMATIVSIYVLLGEELTVLDFMIVMVVGIFGFVSVYFSVRYGREIEEQRREMLAINTISDAISNSVRTGDILVNALKTVVDLLDADYGWIYLAKENNELQLEYNEGADVDIIKLFEESSTVTQDWRRPLMRWERMRDGSEAFPLTLRRIGIRILISQPLETTGGFAGTMILASKDSKKFTEKQMNLLSVFVRQINIALDNAQLFEQLNVSQQLYADLFEHAPDMYHIIDKDGKIVSCNQTEVKMLGYTKDELIGADITILYPEEYHPKLKNNLNRIFNKEENLTGIEERIRRKDGSFIDVSVNTSLMYKDSQPVKVRVAMRNISEKKMMQEKLLQAQRIDSLGNLAGGIAHDFNNIMVAILNAASIMKRKMKNDDPWFDYVDLIESSSRRGGALTQQLLTFARQSDVKYHPVDANVVVRDTARLMERSLDKSIIIESKLSTGSAVIEGDERQLQQVLMNLILNARDAMPQGGTVTLSTSIEYLSQKRILTPHSGEGKFVVLWIRDSGIGMDEVTKKKIFEPFFTTKDADKGTGLGLSVAYSIVNKHRGFITVESEPAKGSIFSIYLPLLSLEKRKKEVIKPSTRKVTGGTEKIIVIEDDILVGRMISDMLTDLGYDVALCESGEEGLRELRSQDARFDLLILDLNMPYVSGREVLLKLREFNETIPVIVSTGYGEYILDEQNLREGIQAYIKKPYDEYEFGTLIRRVLDDHKHSIVE